MKRLATIFVLSFLVMALAAPVEGKEMISEGEDYRAYLEFHTNGVVSALSQDDDGGTLAGQDISAGLDHAIGNIGWSVEYKDQVELFFDATMASRQYNDKWWGHEGYMLVKDLPEGYAFDFLRPALETVNIKAGHFLVDFGLEPHRRSLNADVQSNPLVGNAVVSPHATEPGIEIIRDAERYRFMVGIGSGNSTDNLGENANFSYRAKLSGDLMPGLSGAASYYTVEHDEGVGAYTGSNLFSSERLGSNYPAVWQDASHGQVLIDGGKDMDAYQLDLRYEPVSTSSFRATFGNVDDDESPSSSTDGSEWDHYSVEGVQNLTNHWRAAARYSVADAKEISGDSSNDGDIERIQVGLNGDVTERMMFKLEYVDQEASGFNDNTTYLGDFDLGDNSEFNGFISEVSYSF